MFISPLAIPPLENPEKSGQVGVNRDMAGFKMDKICFTSSVDFISPLNGGKYLKEVIKISF